MMINFLFITNILSQHQVGLWDEFAKFNDINFIYLSTRNKNLVIEERYKCSERQYEKNSFDLSNAELIKIINTSDILFVGSVEDKRVWNLIRKKDNIIWAYEHFSKNRKFELYKLRSFRRKIACLKSTKKFVKNNTTINNYLFCLSYHTKKDWILGGFPKDKIYKFGYFPLMNYANEKTICEKTKNTIVWCGRMIGWKHPEQALYVYKKLSHSSNYTLHYYGDGPLLNKIKKKAEGDNNIFFHSPVAPEAMKLQLLKADIYVFSSDYNEGWGSVLGEAMSSGCIVFANLKAGSTKFLVNKNNGFSYRNGRSLCKALIRYSKMSNNSIFKMRTESINTMQNLYSGRVAAERLYQFVKNIKLNKTLPFYVDGPVSKF